jgi:hypothetical protein
MTPFAAVEAANTVLGKTKGRLENTARYELTGPLEGTVPTSTGKHQQKCLQHGQELKHNAAPKEYAETTCST